MWLYLYFRCCIALLTISTDVKLKADVGVGRHGQELGRVGSRSVGDLPFNISGFPWNLPPSQLLPGPLSSLSQTSSGSLPKEDIMTVMQRELSAERGRMGRISLSQSIDTMQQ